MIMTGGTVGSNQGSGSIEVSGPGAELRVSNGVLDRILLDVDDGGRAQLLGGEFINADNEVDICAVNDPGEPAVEIFGEGFEIDGTPVGFGPLDEVMQGRLTGFLESGDPLDVEFDNRSPGAIVLIEAPEPSVTVLSVAAALTVASLALCLAPHRRLDTR